MSDLYPENPVQCDDCGAHFQLSPSMATDGLACPDCGGKRLFRDQPSPTQSDGTLRDMVDSDSQLDQGGNPLGEGTIVGDDGEQPAWRRDNFSPSMASVSAINVTENVEMPRTLNTEPYLPWTHEASVHTAGPAIPLAVEGEAAALPAEVAAGGAAAGAIGDAAGAAGGLLGDVAGGIGGIAKRVAPSLMKGVLHAGESALGIGGAGGQQSGGMAPEPVTQAPSMMSYGSADIPFVLMADLETPHSVKSVDEQEDDPQQQDQKEFDDESDVSNLKNPHMDDSGADGEDGVRDATPGYGFGDNSPGLERMMMVLPLLLHYFGSEESGEHDPIIKALHETLEKENPGYLKQEDPDGHGLVQMIIEQHKQPRGVHAGVNFPSGLPAVPGGAPMAQAPMMGGGGACPQCGGPLGPDGSCPQCQGMQQGGQPSTSLPPMMANHVGPVTPEQIAAVAQILIDQGRSGEIETMKRAPQLYAEELQQVQQNPNPAPPLVDPAQSQPPMPMDQAPGAMPMPGMGGGAGPGQPMQPMASKSSGHGPNGEVLFPPCPACGQVAGFKPYPFARGFLQCKNGACQHLADPKELADIYNRQTDDLHAAPSTDPLEQQFAAPAAEHPLGPHTGAGYDDMMEAWDDGYGSPACPMCGGPGEQLGSLGLRDHFRCRNCGMDFSHENQERMDQPGGTTFPEEWNHQAAFVTEQEAREAAKLADANNRVPRCPKCDSATTTLVAGADNDPGDALGRCHGCGNLWKLTPPTKESKRVWADLANPVTLPAAQQHDPVDREHTHDPSMQWVDNGGNPLQANQVYELHSPAYPVPDMIQILDVKPDAIKVDLVGQVDSFAPGTADPNSGFEISRQEAQLEHYTFVPSEDAGQDMDANTEPPTGTPGLEQVPPSGQTTDQVADSYPNTALSHVEEDPESLGCLKCGSGTVDHTMVSPTRYSHECVRCAHYWETDEEMVERHSSVDLSWLLGSSFPEDDFVTERQAAMAQAGASGSRNIADIAAKDERLQTIKATLEAAAQARTAGRHFTPGEKRELIDETGRARNLGDLDLSNTHYDTRIDFTGKANGENVDDSHFALGL